MAYGSEHKARKLGAWASSPKYRDLWGVSKRELIEIALHLASRLTEMSADEALVLGAAGDVVRAERVALKRAGML